MTEETRQARRAAARKRGARWRLLRVGKARITSEALAERLRARGLKAHGSQIRAYERGEAAPSVDMAEAIEAALAQAIGERIVQRRGRA